MKYIVKVLCLLTAFLFLLSSCKGANNGDVPMTDEEGNAIIPEVTEKTWATRTNSKGEKIPNVFDDAGSGSQAPDDPVKPPENPITGNKNAEKYHTSHKLISVIKDSLAGENFTPWHDKRDVDALFDGMDGYFNADDPNKMGGNVQAGKLTVSFMTEKTTLVGYAFVTGNDSANYSDRSPLEWTFYGSNDKKDWKVLDYVYDSAIEPENNAYYGYEIDKDKQAEYKYYKFEFTLNINGNPITSFQLNECYLYANKN